GSWTAVGARCRLEVSGSHVAPPGARWRRKKALGSKLSAVVEHTRRRGKWATLKGPRLRRLDIVLRLVCAKLTTLGGQRFAHARPVECHRRTPATLQVSL